jgi:hypothetical protein
MTGSREEEYDFYEDENKEPGVLPFLIREKRIVGYVALVGLCTMVFSCIGRQMDQMGEDSRPIEKGRARQIEPLVEGLRRTT